MSRTQLDVERQLFQNMYGRRNLSTYFTSKVEESKDDPKDLFRFTRNMMGE